MRGGGGVPQAGYLFWKPEFDAPEMVRLFLSIANRIKFTIARRVTPNVNPQRRPDRLAQSDNPRIIEARLQSYL